MPRFAKYFILSVSLLLSACRPQVEQPIIQTLVFETATEGIPSTMAPSATTQPTLTETATPIPCSSSKGEILESSIRSDLLDLPLEFYLYLPPCYDETRATGYPVLYLIHGQSFRQDQWINLGMTDVADEWISEGKAVPFIIVMPRDRIWEQPSLDQFGEALIHDLIPYVDTTYNTDATGNSRALGGLSRGASWTFHLGISYPEMFAGLGGHSLPVFYEDVSRVKPWLENTPRDTLPKIYVDSPDGDFENIRISTGWFIDQLVVYDIPHEFYVFVGYHVEDYWAAHVEDYFDFYQSLWMP